MNKIESKDLCGMIQSAKMQAIYAAEQQEEHSLAMLSALTTVFGAMQVAISFIADEALSSEHGLLDQTCSPGVNTATIAFVATLATKVFVPNPEGLLVNWGPHTLKDALDKCEQDGINIKQYLRSDVLEMLASFDDTKTRAAVSKLLAEEQAKRAKALN